MIIVNTTAGSSNAPLERRSDQLSIASTACASRSSSVA